MEEAAEVADARLEMSNRKWWDTGWGGFDEQVVGHGLGGGFDEQVLPGTRFEVMYK